MTRSFCASLSLRQFASLLRIVRLVQPQPAALLAATAIKDAFVLQSVQALDIDSRVFMAKWRLVRYAYLLLMITAFGLDEEAFT